MAISSPLPNSFSWKADFAAKILNDNLMAISLPPIPMPSGLDWSQLTNSVNSLTTSGGLYPSGPLKPKQQFQSNIMSGNHQMVEHKKSLKMAIIDGIVTTGSFVYIPDSSCWNWRDGQKVCRIIVAPRGGISMDLPPLEAIKLLVQQGIPLEIQIEYELPNGDRSVCSCGDLDAQRIFVRSIVSEKIQKKFERIVIEQEKLEIIETAVSQLENHDLIFNKWGFGEKFEKGTAVSLLFYGPPGTGKTLTAQAIAERFGMELKLIQTAEIESSEPGQAERNIKSFFENAVAQNQLLLFDECDSLICDRNEVGMILGAQINALLTSLEHFTGICVFTTNRLGKMDPAFERRVSAKVEFQMPDEAARKQIWQKLIPKKAPIGKDVNFDTLAKFEIAGGHIKNSILSAARFAAFKKKKEIDEECFTQAISAEIAGKQQFEDAISEQPKIPRLGRPRGDYGMDSGRKTIVKEKVSRREMRRQRKQQR